VQNFYQACEAIDTDQESFCLGYLLGIADLMAANHSAASHIQGTPKQTEMYHYRNELVRLIYGRVAKASIYQLGRKTSRKVAG